MLKVFQTCRWLPLCQGSMKPAGIEELTLAIEPERMQEELDYCMVDMIAMEPIFSSLVPREGTAPEDPVTWVSRLTRGYPTPSLFNRAKHSV
jgi:hypothetical protein